MMRESNTEAVYHYCSVETFLKIIQRKTLRLSDIGKSNDYEERVYIEKKILEALIDRVADSMSPTKIDYDEKSQKRFAEKQVQTIIDALQRKGTFAAFSEVYENDVNSIGCMKNSGFSEEKEWRLCIGMTPEIRTDCEAKFSEFSLSNVKEQVVRDQIVTYFDLTFENVVDRFITEVVIGPSAKVTVNDIKRSLYINGFPADRIKVSKSAISYR